MKIEFVKYLDLGSRTMLMYSETHPRTQQVIQQGIDEIGSILKEKENVTISVTEGNLLVEGEMVEKGNPVLDRLSRDLFMRNVHSLTFNRGITRDEWISILRHLNLKPQKMQDLGGLAAILHNEGVKSIVVNKIKYGVITEGEAALNQELMSQLLFSVQALLAGRGDATVTAENLEKTLDENTASDPAGLLFRIFQTISQKAPGLPDQEKLVPVRERFTQMYRSFTPAMQGKLLISAVLKSGTLPAGLNDFYRDLSPDEIEASVLSLAGQPISRSDLKEFFATLQKEQLISLDERIEQKLTELGLVEEKTPPIWEKLLMKAVWNEEDIESTPGVLQELLAQGNLNEAEWISKRAFGCLGGGTSAQKIAAIKIIPSLVRVLSQHEKWKNLETSLSLLAGTCYRKETAQDVLETWLMLFLSSFEGNLKAENFSACDELIPTIRSQTDKNSTLNQKLVSYLRELSPFLSAHLKQAGSGAETSLQYIKSCGTAGASFLLDSLAEEEDTHARAHWISHVQRFEPRFLLPEMERRISDPRWYVVRNLITILGKMILRETPALLMQAASHPDPRVAREVMKNLFKSATPADTAVILRLLQHPDKSVRLQAIHLSSIAGVTDAIPVLLGISGNVALADTDLRTAAFQSLLKFRSSAALVPARAVFEKTTGNKAEPAERMAAVRLLGELGRAENRGLLQSIAKSDPNQEIRALAASYV